MNQEDVGDIVLQAIEVLLNQILYVRGVYPENIFKKRRVYNAPVFVSIFPALNEYLDKVLGTARTLLHKKELERLELIIYHNGSQTLERYSLKLSDKSFNAGDSFMLHFEEQLRGILYTLSERLNKLQKLPQNSQFKVILHTTQAGMVRLSNNSRYQDFPWLQDSHQHNDPEMRQIELLPLSGIDTVGLQFQVEI